MTLDERAEIVAEMVEGGFCTHYGGYVCDRDFPTACAPCITSWIIRLGITKREDPRLNYKSKFDLWLEASERGESYESFKQKLKTGGTA